MRKFVVPALSLALCLGLVTGCSSKTSAPAETSASAEETTSEASAEDSSEAESTEPQSVDSLKIAFLLTLTPTPLPPQRSRWRIC